MPPTCRIVSFVPGWGITLIVWKLDKFSESYTGAVQSRCSSRVTFLNGSYETISGCKPPRLHEPMDAWIDIGRVFIVLPPRMQDGSSKGSLYTQDNRA